MSGSGWRIKKPDADPVEIWLNSGKQPEDRQVQASGWISVTPEIWPDRCWNRGDVTGRADFFFRNSETVQMWFQAHLE
jgi:hypothetical protein